MTDQDDCPKNVAALRQKAESLARERAAQPPEAGAGLSPEEIWKIVYELQVHQIELEMQNEELRAAQAEIEAARARYFDLYDLAPVGYCTLSERGLILEGNLAASKMLGTSRAMLMKLPISRFILKDDQDIFYLHRKRLFETGEPQECELRMVSADGHCVWAQLRGTISRAEDGATVCRLAMSDISQRKRAEEDNAKLEAQLMQARKMEWVGMLAGGTAHYFNNMLAVILGNVDAAMEVIAPGHPPRNELEEIQSAAQRSADITRQLLAFARKQIIAPKVLDLNDTIESLLKLLRRLIGEGIALDWMPGPSLWPIKMDPAQIDQILTSLCVNARDAIAGPGKITIATRNMTLGESYCALHAGFTPGDYVALIIKDDGCGMDEKTRSLLFEPFFTTKETGKGTGLGLATVYGIVKQNRGLIDFSSELGTGSSFYVFLPRNKAVAETLPTSARSV